MNELTEAISKATLLVTLFVVTVIPPEQFFT
jgi:hypothetical protein